MYTTAPPCGLALTNADVLDSASATVRMGLLSRASRGQVVRAWQGRAPVQLAQQPLPRLPRIGSSNFEIPQHLDRHVCASHSFGRDRVGSSWPEALQLAPRRDARCPDARVGPNARLGVKHVAHIRHIALQGPGTNRGSCTRHATTRFDRARGFARPANGFAPAACRTCGGKATTSTDVARVVMPL